MKRRSVLAAGLLGLAGILAARRVRAQAAGIATNRAAVVIGVDKAGKLPKLKSAASDAMQVAAWLRSQDNFEVKLFTDQAGQPVVHADLFNAVSGLIDQGTLDQLVIYFAGHGFLNYNSEHWLLSNALDPAEVVSLDANVNGARLAGIPNVVFVSDACRSTPESLGAVGVSGSGIFPLVDRAMQQSAEVDRWFAALPGRPALEVPVDTSSARFEGLYTAALLDAFAHPEADLVKTVDGIFVLPNRALKKFLAHEVPRRAEAKSLKLEQQPDAYLESGADAYIGRVQLEHDSGAEVWSDRSGPATLAQLAQVRLQELTSGYTPEGGGPLGPASLKALAEETGFDSSRQRLVRAEVEADNAAVAFRTGFVVLGANLASVSSNASVITHKGKAPSEPELIEIAPALNAPSSVGLSFASGTGTVLAALPGYIGTVVVEQDRVVSVSYIPSRQSYLWSDYQQEHARLMQLRAAVATAAQFGVFRLDGGPAERQAQASALADQIRVLKSIDPTLGIYAAYAYAQAGLIEQVNSVAGYMREELGVDIFDVGLLAGTLVRSSVNPEHAVPFCPMLSQGWGLLRVRGVEVAEAISPLRDHVLPALWSTYDAGGVGILALGAVSRG